MDLCWMCSTRMIHSRRILEICSFPSLHFCYLFSFPSLHFHLFSFPSLHFCYLFSFPYLHYYLFSFPSLHYYLFSFPSLHFYFSSVPSRHFLSLWKCRPPDRGVPTADVSPTPPSPGARCRLCRRSGIPAGFCPCRPA